MPTAAERRMFLRRIALMLWITWAIAVWNVVFDYVIVVAGREYLAAAIAASHAAGPYPRMDDWMRPAVTRGLWMATAASAAILVVGLTAIRAASVNQAPRENSQGPSEGTPGRVEDSRSA
jgi:hypothetical protein